MFALCGPAEFDPKQTNYCFIYSNQFLYFEFGNEIDCFSLLFSFICFSLNGKKIFTELLHMRDLLIVLRLSPEFPVCCLSLWQIMHVDDISV